ncbi:VOC family protein [Paracoccus sp. (in: a-proteobacteria)]|uniref:VOC family protein n=1 Tax=Paracoccus sp. TaxID=267 RepID=UPI00289C4FFE|nr:VOC family protein [Paracoccus sp. (in: a-proteobacteria)]
MSDQGKPCWYELGTSDLNAAAQFYSTILGWQIFDSGMEGFDYRLARAEAGDGEDGDMVAGMMSIQMQQGSPPPNWLIYFAVDDCDGQTAKIAAAGGRVYKAPADIPGTGRFSVVADPQGAVFGLLQADLSQMSAAEIAKFEAGGGAYSPDKAGHGNWNELMTSDPAAGLAFYTDLFGWTKGETMDMGEMGSYQLLRHKGVDFGAIMGLGDAPMPCWLPYFGINGAVSQVVQSIKDQGGSVHMGPMEVPGPAYIAVARDPQGAWFAVVGPQP